ncbi:dihydrolipoamide acetyltransferase family protein [Allosphingosinicella deserti]|uniref:dihydrolipoamide acetyltransferase family protein n=1 Tax=Allosphingosinicella deserti TaxID=2116704 RepID=UPI001E4ED1E8|nr:2-oxo acid dehydrogenase subunit E2 [Sphingomonas deserti]
MIDVVVPIEQEGTKAVVRAWLKQIGDRVELNDPLVELETDKVAMEVPAPVGGVLREILLDLEAEAVPGAILGRIDTDGERANAAPATGAASPPPPSPATYQPDVRNPELRLSPAVKRACLQHAVDPTTIAGTGRGGRVTRADVDKAVAEGRAAPTATVADTRSRSDAGLRSHDVPHDRMRLKIAENMLASVTQAPHVTAVFEADFSAIIAHRERHKADFSKRGVKLTYSAYFVAAAAEAMKVAPAINSRWHSDRLEVFDDVNVGVGTALGEKGLIVPVLRQVQTLSLEGVAAGLDRLVEKARAQTLTGADVSGGTFTISNHGVSGSLFASPIIIAQPQSAILGIGKLEKRVVVREVAGQDAILIRPMAYVSLTIDHRVVDGHQTNAWLTRFVEVLESWPAD